MPGGAGAGSSIMTAAFEGRCVLTCQLSLAGSGHSSSGITSALPRCSLLERRQALRQPGLSLRDARLMQWTAHSRHFAARIAPPSAQQLATVPDSSGNDTFNWFDQWYPIHFVKDLDKNEPQRFVLLNLPLVIWWAPGAGAWEVFLDACPHRLVPLSEGRITPEGELECPYHGWRFSAHGQCTAIPEGGDPSSSRCSATAFPSAVRQGMLWVKPVPLDNVKRPINYQDIPLQPEIEDPGWGAPLDVFRDLPYDAATLLENVLDVGHVPFTHHGTVSRRETAGVYDLAVTERAVGGFKGEWLTSPRNGKWGPQSTQFVAPNYLRHTLEGAGAGGFANVTSVYVAPIAPGRCRALIRNQLKFASPLPGLIFRLLPSWLAHQSNNRVLEDDVIFLHEQEPLAVSLGMGVQPMGQVYHMPGASDAFVMAFRSWLDRVGGGGPWGPMNAQWLQAAGPRFPREQLLERYHSHTANCKECSAALTNVRRALEAVRVLTTLSLVALAATIGGAAAATQPALAASATPAEALRILAVSRPVLAAAGTLVVAAVLKLLQHLLARLERGFLVGDYPPPRNMRQ